MIKEMHRHAGPLVIDEQGIALRGVLLHHLVMPGGVAGTPEIMTWIGRELGPETYIDLMAQYHPAGRVTDAEHPEINRCVSRSELEQAIEVLYSAGLTRLDREPTSSCGRGLSF